MTQPLAWSHRASEIPDAGLSISRAATAAERLAIAQALDIVSCEVVTADYAVRPLGEARYRMSGRISARLTQCCVVTLAPIPQTLEEPFDITFWPSGSLPHAGDAEAEVLSAPEIESIEHGTIEAGRVLYEILSASLDPYPRQAGARFEWEEPETIAEQSRTGPFASLKKLKDD
jgi:uncharacterized metal-binding protein YceD (DUF177 family)